MFGDKDFTTMIIYEADLLGFGSEIIDKKDKEGLTPLFLLCEEGYRKRETFNEEEEEIYSHFVKDLKIKAEKSIELKKSKKTKDSSDSDSTDPDIPILETDKRDLEYDEF